VLEALIDKQIIDRLLVMRRSLTFNSCTRSRVFSAIYTHTFPVTHKSIVDGQFKLMALESALAHYLVVIYRSLLQNFLGVLILRCRQKRLYLSMQVSSDWGVEQVRFFGSFALGEVRVVEMGVGSRCDL